MKTKSMSVEEAVKVVDQRILDSDGTEGDKRLCTALSTLVSEVVLHTNEARVPSGETRESKQATNSEESTAIMQRALFLMRGTATGKSFDSDYFWTVTLAAESLYTGSGQAARFLGIAKRLEEQLGIVVPEVTR